MKATIWRFLMRIGMGLHNLARPFPPNPSFTVKVPSRLSKSGGYFKLVFYTPPGYDKLEDDTAFPVVINYHGGGFTLGTATDDSRWAMAVTRDTGAVLVSVEYRLAPEHPFSIGIEDSADAVVYLAAHAEELRIDPHRIVLSGFSAGANFSLTVPLLLHDLRMGVGKRSLQAAEMKAIVKGHEGIAGNSDPSINAPTRSSSSVSLPIKPLNPTTLETDQDLPDFSICGIVSFYPPTDFRISRESKRKTNPKPEKDIPAILTDMFDAAYIPNDGQTTCDLDLADPYLSPAAASDTLLTEAYPPLMVIYTCEWDMLNAEGVAFGARLKEAPINIDVKGGLIKEVPHAFDKSPNPIKFSDAANRCYAEACAELRLVFGESKVKGTKQLSKVKDVERFEDDEGQMEERVS